MTDAADVVVDVEGELSVPLLDVITADVVVDVEGELPVPLLDVITAAVVSLEGVELDEDAPGMGVVLGPDDCIGVAADVELLSMEVPKEPVYGVVDIEVEEVSCGVDVAEGFIVTPDVDSVSDGKLVEAIGNAEIDAAVSDDVADSEIETEG